MKIAVVGTGYVGLTTGACLAEHGHQVLCIDSNPERAAALRRGDVPFYEPGLEALVHRHMVDERLAFAEGVGDRAHVEAGKGVAEAEVIFIAVGTPPLEDGGADLSALAAAARGIGAALSRHAGGGGLRVVVNKSTAPVGTAARIRGWLAEGMATGYADRSAAAAPGTAFVHLPFAVVANPEFLSEGSAVKDCLNPDRIVLGVDHPEAEARMRRLYALFDAPILAMQPAAAELVKYASNAFLATKISFINEIAELCRQSGADVREVARAVGLDARIGAGHLQAGLGFGGSCLPKDVSALLGMAAAAGVPLRVVQAAADANSAGRDAFCARVAEAVGELGGKTIGLLGLAFKPGTDDIRESPALDLAERFLAAGARLRVFDPRAMAAARPVLDAAAASGRDAAAEEAPAAEAATRPAAGDAAPATPVFCERAEDVADGADALVLATEWPAFRSLPWAEMAARMAGKDVFDGRNVLDANTIAAAGLVYHGVGVADG